MIRLMYFSTATQNMSGADVDEIIAHSVKKNTERGVTGMLAYNGRNFCQVLEGEKEAVDDLVEVIRADVRHSGFKVLGEKPITQRHYEGWAMKRVDDLDFSEAINVMDA